MKAGVLLSGCGVYDGSEIQEAVFTLLALDQLNIDAQCIAPNKAQHHVINHLTGEETGESRNVLVESARIARGDIQPLEDVDFEAIDALVIPGGFGVAKNLSTWAFAGAEAIVEPGVKSLIHAMHQAGKPIVALCIAPVLLAKTFSEIALAATLTLGNTKQPSDYNIYEFHEAISNLGMHPESCALGDIVVDNTHKLISSPCYMLQGTPREIYQGVYKACERMKAMAA